jgi:hypothetical protein
MGYVLRDGVSDFWEGQEIFSSSKCLDWPLGPPSLLFCVYVGVQQMGCEVKNCLFFI